MEQVAPLQPLLDVEALTVCFRSRAGPVHAVSEMLGIDPFEVANEGKVVMDVRPDKAEEVLKAIKGEKYGENAAIIGEVVEGEYVIVNTPIGGERILEAPIADPVPRVC